MSVKIKIGLQLATHFAFGRFLKGKSLDMIRVIN